jgi:DNA-binding protein HU-beta
MIKKDVIEMVKEELGGSAKDAEKALDAVLNAIVEGCVLHGEVGIRGFGKFRVKTFPPRTCVSPLTKEVCNLPELKVIKFKSSRSIAGL